MAKQKQMKEIRTENFDITNLISEDNKRDILATMEQYAQAYEIFGSVICENHVYDMNVVHAFGYRLVTSKLPELPTAVVQASARHSAANIKSYNSNVPAINQGRKKYNKKCKEYNEKIHNEEDSFKQPMKEKPLLEQWDTIPELKSHMYTLNTRSCTVNSSSITFSTVNNRVKVPYTTTQWFADKYPNRRFYSAKIISYKHDTQFILKLSYVIGIFEEANVSELSVENFLGVDRGIYNTAATSDGRLYSSKKSHAVTRKIAYAKKTARQHCTSSSRRRVRRLTKREVRYTNNVNSIIAKDIVTSNNNVKCLVEERLTGISKNTRSKRMSPKMRRMVSSWKFRDLSEKIKRYCAVNGIAHKEINPYNTSRKCSMCGTVTKGARKGNKYKCPVCGHTEHADINAAKNIRDKYIDNLSNYLRVHSTTPILNESLSN